MKKSFRLKFITLFILFFIILGTYFVAHGADQTSSDAPATAVPPTSSTNLPNPIQVVEPEENAHLPALSSTFVCGSVPEGGKLTINDSPVTVHPGGGFLTMVHLSPGEFQIKCDLQLGSTFYHFIRTIFVASPEQPSPVSPMTIEWAAPGIDQELLPGDYVEVSCKGSPGMTASFSVSGIQKKFPMIESASATAGIYHGVFQLGNDDLPNQAKITVTLTNQLNQEISKEAAGSISIFPHDVPVMVQTTSPYAVLRAGPAINADDHAGYLFYPPVGTLLQITGRIDNEYRVRLTPTKTVWVSADLVQRLPLGTPPSNVVVGNVSINTDQSSTLIRIPLARKIPFKVDPDVDGKYLDLSIYGAYSNTDVISHEATGIVDNVSWHQDDAQTYRLRINTHPGSWWGFDARFEGDDTHPILVLELRTPPPVTADNSPLAGLTIAVDAGHGAGGGAMGVTGYAEGDANMAMALNLRDKLIAKGAKVILTRPGDADPSLTDRPRFAWQNRADLLISLHNNSYGYGGNPLLSHGFGIYYYTPMSLPMAISVHNAYIDAFAKGNNPTFNLPDNGLYYDNLALTRPTQMPAILIETGFMIVPEEEAELKTDAFRSACSDAIIHGLEDYAHAMRPVAARPVDQGGGK